MLPNPGSAMEAALEERGKTKRQEGSRRNWRRREMKSAGTSMEPVQQNNISEVWVWGQGSEGVGRSQPSSGIEGQMHQQRGTSMEPVQQNNISEIWGWGQGSEGLGRSQPSSGIEGQMHQQRWTGAWGETCIETERMPVGIEGQMHQQRGTGAWGETCIETERIPVPQETESNFANWKETEGGGRNWSGWDEPIATQEQSGWDEPIAKEEQSDWAYPRYNAYGPSTGSGFDCCDSVVEILGKKVLVTVAASAATVESWLDEYREETKLGLDIEWRPTFQKGDYHVAAILQLSLETRCLLVQLLHIDVFPSSLRRFLADPNVMLGGVGIKEDTKKLKEDHGLECAGEVELGPLAASILGDQSLRKAGISTLTKRVLGVTYKKDRRSTMSNWEIRGLTFRQIQYAAADAWLSHSILVSLHALKKPPTSRQSYERVESLTPTTKVGENRVRDLQHSGVA